MTNSAPLRQVNPRYVSWQDCVPALERRAVVMQALPFTGMLRGEAQTCDVDVVLLSH